jgi:hypothetical protein
MDVMKGVDKPQEHIKITQLVSGRDKKHSGFLNWGGHSGISLQNGTSLISPCIKSCID